MTNPQAKLIETLFDPNKLEQKATRDGFGTGLVKAGEKDERIVGLCADLTESTRMDGFKERFPHRFIQMGVAEQNLATVGAGLALYGKIPFIASYAAFSPGRNWEQLRTTVCINDIPVKIVGAHAGISVGPDGATHQILEDIALMRVLPRMTVVVPCDSIEAHKATLAIASDDQHPSYIRLAREKSPVFTTQDTPFEIGKAEIFKDPSLNSGQKADVVVIACGSLVYHVLEVATQLEPDGINVMVINNHTIKPLDTYTIINAAKTTGAVVTVEEHQVAGGLGSAVAETLAKHYPTPQEFVGIQDRFGQSGNTSELMKEYELDTNAIKKAIERVLKRKNNL